MGTETIKRLSAVILLCTIGGASSPSFAQSSGSTGGTVGKEDKSISGGVTQQRRAKARLCPKHQQPPQLEDADLFLGDGSGTMA